MQEVIDFILTVIKGGYEILNNFSITVYGFTFSMWDFLLALFVLSCIAPLVVAPNSSGGIPNLISIGRGASERIKQNNAAYNEASWRSEVKAARRKGFDIQKHRK